MSFLHIVFLRDEALLLLTGTHPDGSAQATKAHPMLNQAQRTSLSDREWQTLTAGSFSARQRVAD